MKLIHTADWHIGQNFYGYDRKEEHLAFFDWLKKTVANYRADVLLVAGDVFDSPNPSAESQRMYYRLLRDLTAANPHLQVIITAGNHDSAARLEAPHPLLEEMNVQVRGLVKRDAEGRVDYRHLLVPLREKGETLAWCLAVPYLRQGDYPGVDSYGLGIKAFYEQLYEMLREENEKGLPVLVMGHLQATGSEVSENDRSERTVIGGLECVAPDVFDAPGVVYTALGHLHKAQRVSGREHIRYAGAPLPMSFAEKHYKQGVNLIEIEKGTLKGIERLVFEPPVALMSLPKEPKPLVEVLQEIEALPEGEPGPDSPYLELKVLLTEPEPSMRHKIEEALQHKAVRLASAVSFRAKQDRETGNLSYEELKALSPMEMAEDVYQSRYGNPMPDKMKVLLQQVIEEVSR